MVADVFGDVGIGIMVKHTLPRHVNVTFSVTCFQNLNNYLLSIVV